MTRLTIVGRRGFTLVELLVVLAILAILFTLTTAAVTRFYGAGNARVTDTTVRLVKTMIERQWKDVSDRANQEPIPPAVESNANMLAAGEEPVSGRARVLYIKLKQKHAFPMNFSEVFNPYIAGYAMKDYQAYLTKYGYTQTGTAAWPTPAIQNAVCLMMILEIGPGGSGANNSELTNISKVLATNGTQQVRGLVDGYSNPLVFARHPTQFANLATTAPLDGADPRSYLSSNVWRATANATSASTAIGHGFPVTRRLQPVVASMGADGQLGLNTSTFAVTSAAQTTDNKYTTDY